jgi:hypothetical protein
MLQFINDLPDYVVGIRATGIVDKEDYERVLIPRMEELSKKQGKVNYLLVLETDLKNFTAAAWWEDFKLGVKNLTKWGKIAIVTDQKSVERLGDVFTHFIPGESRGFKISELNEAMRWVTEKDLNTEPETITSDQLFEDIHSRRSNTDTGRVL